MLSEILLIILDNAQKKKDYNSAKNCIILSQTFYYNDKSKEGNKVYILEYIKKHVWLKSMEFWKDFALIMILREFKKLEDMNDNMKINIGKNKNIPENFEIKIGEVLFSQLLPYVGNMSEFNLEKKYIIKIIDDIINKYNYLDKSNLETIYELVCSSKEEINEVKEQIKNDKELVGSTINEAIIKKKCKREDDEEEEEDEQELN